MPKETSDIRDFLKRARQADAKVVKIKKDKIKNVTKFKLRLSRYLYTLKVADQAKADKIAASFPQGLKKEVL